MSPSYYLVGFLLVITLAAALFLNQMGYLSVRVAPPVTEPLNPTPAAEAEVAATSEPDTTMLEFNRDGTETIRSVTTPSLPETCQSVKDLHILHCGHVAPEQNHACRTSESEA